MRVAVAQIEPELGEKKRNLDVCLARLEEAGAAGAQLLVLPECAIPGYMFESREEAMPFAEEIPGPATDILATACRRLGTNVVFGSSLTRRTSPWPRSPDRTDHRRARRRDGSTW
jgi:predicted amidohydrolase